MGRAPQQEMFFLPADTAGEAITRIYSLTGASNSTTRGEKRAIVALRDALGLDIDTTRTNAVMARQIADALDVEWRSSFEELNRVNLDGLNALLEGAASAYHAGSLRRLASQRPAGLDAPRWEAFEPARSKIEAVNRISQLTGSGPEWLGPGSKEHKSVLIHLSEALTPQLDTSLSKTKLGAALAGEFGAPWSDACESTGETISLVGLNVILAGAELRLGRLGVTRALLAGTPEEEGLALAGALLDGWRAERQPDGGRRVRWDGRRSIEWMSDEGLTRGPNDNEWQGFYFEARGRQILNSAFAPNPSPPRTRYGNTDFDYSLRYVWDLKAHTQSWRYPLSGAIRPGQSTAPLNDQTAMDECAAEQGLGFLMLSGVAVADEDGAFVEWQRDRKAAYGVRSKPSNSGQSRMRKAAFEPQHVEAFFFHNRAAIEAAKAAGQLTGFSQGKQAPDELGEEGRDRRPKYGLAVSKARGSEFAVGWLSWTPEVLATSRQPS